LNAADNPSYNPENGSVTVSNNSLMNSEITDLEAKKTFGKRSDTAGPDGIYVSMIDKVDKDNNASMS